MADNQVTLEINVDAKDAQKAIDQFGAKAVKSIKDVESGFNGAQGSVKELGGVFSTLKNSFGVVATGIAGIVGLFKGLEASIKEATDEAKELKQIEFALRATGEASDVSVKSITDFTESIRKATTIDDGFVNQLFVQAKAFGINTEDAKKLTQAAIDLAAATGQDVETSLRQLGGTLDGSAGKINLLGAEFRNLSTEQLKNGEAIDLVSKKYGGSAAAEADTYQGSVNRLSNSFKDLATEVGKAVTESDLFKESANALSSVVEAQAKEVEKLRKGTASFGREELSFVRNIEQAQIKALETQAELKTVIGKTSENVKTGLESIIEAEKGLSPKNIKEFTDILGTLGAKSQEVVGLRGKEAEESRKRFEDLLKSIVTAGETEIETAKRVRDERLKLLQQTKEDNTATELEIAKAREKIIKEYSNVIQKQFDDVEKLTEDFANVVEKEAQKAAKAFDKIAKAEGLGILDFEKGFQLREKIIKDFNDKRLKEADEVAKKEADIAKKAAEDTRNYIQGISQNPIKIVTEAQQGGEAVSTGAAITAAVLGGIDKALEGRAGAVKLISELGGAIADVFLPGIGGVVTSILGKLSQGKEQAKAFVKEFVSSIPEIIEAILEAIPAVIEAFVEVFSRPGFWVALGKAFVNGAAAILGLIINEFFRDVVKGGVQALSSGVREFVAGFSEVITNFFEGIGPAVGSAVDGIVASITGAFTGAFDRFANIFTGIVDGFKNIFDPLISALNSLKDAVDKVAGATGSGGGEGVIAEFGQRLGFASGGVVPGVANGLDKVPAMLTPGELVVPRDLVGALGSFLENQDGGASGQEAAILMAILQAVQAPISINSSVQVNQSAFADIMLQLNRQNARVVA